MRTPLVEWIGIDVTYGEVTSQVNGIWQIFFCFEKIQAGAVASRSRAASVETRAPQLADAFVNEDAHLVGHQPGLRIDDLDRHRLGLELFQHVFQLPALSIGRDHVRQEHAQAHAVDAGIDGRINLIAGDDAVNRNTLLPMTNLKMPLVASNQTEMSDALVRADVVWDLRHAVAAQVLLARTDDAAYTPDWNRHQRGIAQGSEET